jgi:hypothetical protein
METVRDVLKKAKKLGAKCTERTFWHYHKLRLLPDGQKISGRGNVVFFPRDTAVRIWLVYFLTAELGFSISEIARYPWAQFDIGNTLSAFHGLPEDFVFGTKRKLQKLRDDSLKYIMKNISAVIGVAGTGGNPTAVEIHNSPQSGKPIPSKIDDAVKPRAKRKGYSRGYDRPDIATEIDEADDTGIKQSKRGDRSHLIR